MLSLSRIGARSRRAASLTSLTFWAGAEGCGILTGAGIGGIAGICGAGIGAFGAAKLGIGARGATGRGAIGRGAIGRGAGREAGFGAINGPTGSAILPVSPSGMEDGAATGSAKTGSELVFFVMSSIAFCKSLSTVGFWFILCPPLI